MKKAKVVLTKEEKIAKVKAMSPEQLLESWKWYSKHFNPIDDDICESYEIVRVEILERMNGGK